MKKTVLIVEDDAFLRDIIKKKLINEGFGAEGVADVYGAKQFLQRNSVDLILLDLLLPGAEGFELLDSMKNDPQQKNIPVIVFSNLSDEEDKQRAFRAGAFDFLVKTENTPDSIVKKIKDTLQRMA